MSVSQRKFRAAVYAYTDAGTGGDVTSTYTRVNSTDTDRLWWCSWGVPTGFEPTVGMRPEERVDAVIGFHAEVTGVNRDSLILIGTTQFMVRSVLPRKYGTDEIQCLCENVSGQTFSLTDPA